MTKEELEKRINEETLIINSDEWYLAHDIQEELDKVYYAAERGCFPENMEDIFKYRRSWGDGEILLKIANMFRDGEVKNVWEIWGTEPQVIRLKEVYDSLSTSFRFKEKIAKLCDLSHNPKMEIIKQRVMYRALVCIYKDVVSTHLTKKIRTELEELYHEELDENKKIEI